MEALISKRNVYYKQQNLQTLQPFLVIVGPLHDTGNTYVVCGEALYKCSTIIEAIDLCFKLFFSLQIDYSFATAHIWSFLHIFIYSLTDFNGMLNSKKYVLEFISNLKNHKK